MPLFSEGRRVVSARWIPFRLLLLLGTLLLCVAVFFVVRNDKAEGERMLAGMKAQADVLIWAFEGAARSLPQGQADIANRQRFVEEVARQPHVLYLAVTDSDGRILAHSEPERVGQVLHTPEQMRALADLVESRGTFVESDDEEVFEVAKPFTPSVRRGHRGHGRERHTGPPPLPSETAPPAPSAIERDAPPAMPPAGPSWSQGTELYIFVGMDTAPFNEIRENSVLTTGVVTFSLALVVFAGLSLIFFMQGYQASRRLLRDARSLMLHLFENLPVGLLLTNQSGAVTLYNKHSAAMLGLEEKPGGGVSVREYPLWDWQGLMREMDEEGPILEREVTVSVPGRKTLPVSMSASAVNKGDGSPSGYLFILRDLGEVKNLQQQLRLNERLTALGNMAAGVAHEIRNPLSTIKGYATYLAGKFTSGDPAGEIAHMMSEEVERLNRVVSDLLSVAGAGRLTPVPALLSPLVEKALRLAGGEAEGKGVSLAYDSSGLAGGDILLRLDGDKFVQALLNLVINAVQATDKGGGVRVAAVLTQDEAGGTEQVLVSITDTGSGMSREVLTGLFTPYFTTKASGTGLGLTIALQIIEQHNGRITVSSQPGKGSTFTLILPTPPREKD